MSNITEDEAQLYDRQIRLWGVETQQKLRASRILIVGVRGVASEVAKNLVLVGVKSVVLCDHEAIGENDLAAFFFVGADDLGKNRAEASVASVQALNPRVDVRADTRRPTDLPDDYIAGFHAVLCTVMDKALLLHLNRVCRAHHVKMFAAHVFGMVGFFYSDLGDSHAYIEEKTVSSGTGDGESTIETHSATVAFSSFAESFGRSFEGTVGRDRKTIPTLLFSVIGLLEFHAQHGRLPQSAMDAPPLYELVRDAVRTRGLDPDAVVPRAPDAPVHPAVARTVAPAELAPVCALVGGTLAQEIQKAVTGKDLPLQNSFFYDAVTALGVVQQW